MDVAELAWAAGLFEGEGAALEARELQTFTKLEGGRVLAQGRMVAWVEEIADE